MLSDSRPYHYNIGQRLDSFAADSGENPALVFSDGTIVSHAALAAKARGIALVLKQAGLKRGEPTAIFGGKSLNVFATLHGALRLGSPVVMLDPASPPERLARILETAAPAVIMTDPQATGSLIAAAKTCGVQIIDLSQIDIPKDPGPLPETLETQGSDVAYIMFTSGSTGFPKGVAIAHACVLNLADWARETFAITPDDILTSVNPLYFDNSVFDHYAALLNGASLALFDKSLVQDPHLLTDAVEKAGCTIWFSVPSLLVYVMRLRALKQDTWPRMRHIGFGGEGYPKADAKRLFDLFAERVQLWNIYGPTEGTCICSAYRVGAADFGDMTKLLPLGHLAPKFDGLVLDDKDHRCAVGEPGELCLSGEQLANGYWRDPERTAAAFVPIPAGLGTTGRMYRTGDLVRIDPGDGYLHFLGRIDNQIKHMGYRIELEEIEAAINGLAYVQQAAVVYQAAKSGALAGQIIAVLVGDPDLNHDQLRQDLASFLPDYMMPADFQIRDTLPKNANGKVDRGALAAELNGSGIES